MPFHEQPDKRFTVYQIDMAAEMHLTPWWRRGKVLRRRLPEAFRYAKEARRAGKEVGFQPKWFLRSGPHPLALLLCFGRTGEGLVKRLLGI